ncbi:hypothetical protein RB195_013532 [Necator americanus]|uniref:Uncharacterized protein n=1 Tax=Necator americanus TaxID=51031 RepID=A0ABR1DX46_NECAM
MNDEDLETIDEVGEEESEAKDEDERDEPSEDDVVTEQIDQGAQQSRAQVATDRVKPARRNSDRVEPARAEGAHPEEPVRDPAREREQRRQQLRAELRNEWGMCCTTSVSCYKSWKDSLHARNADTTAQTYDLPSGNHMLCVLRRNPTAL